MSRSNKCRPSADKGNKAGRGAREGAHVAPIIRGALAGAGCAVAVALVSALIFAAFGVRAEDPARLAPIFALVTLALSSAAAGVAVARTAGVSPLLCAAAGAGIAAAALLLSLIPALPEVPLPAPKAICAAIPIVFSFLGGRLAAPRRGRRRRRR